MKKKLYLPSNSNEITDLLLDSGIINFVKLMNISGNWYKI